jgi:transcription antitermination factor NusG
LWHKELLPFDSLIDACYCFALWLAANRPGISIQLRVFVFLRLTPPGASRILWRVSENLWFVAHTKPRREKKLVDYCQRQGFAATLPCYDSAHKYRGKTVVFRKPLFPGYVFLQLEPVQKDSVRQNDHVANLLEVFDQETFWRQLQDILLALESNLGVRLAPAIGEGMRVRIKGGPLEGLEGWVEKRYGMTTVLLRLDFINQAAAVKVDADLLMPI